MARKNKDRKVIMARNTVIGFISLLAIGVFSLFTYVSMDLEPGEVVASEDYLVIDSPRPRRQGDPIEVVEFFSYACIHCMTFDPIIEDWAEDQQDDVVFRRQPTTFSPIYALLAQTYYALEATGALEQNHNRIFRAIHDARRQFLTPDMVAEYVDGRGVSKEDFLRAFDSPEVRKAMRDADRDQRIFQITGTPSLVVAGKYTVGMGGGQGRALQVVDQLISQERGAEETP